MADILICHHWENDGTDTIDRGRVNAMHTGSRANRPINLALLALLCFTLTSCGTLQITFEKPLENSADALAASPAESSLGASAAPFSAESTSSESIIPITPISTNTVEAPSPPASIPSNLEPITLDFIHMANETHGWAFAERTMGDSTYRTILHSQDGGHTWHDRNKLGIGSYFITSAALGFFLDANTAWTMDHYDWLKPGASKSSTTFLRWFFNSACESEHTSTKGDLSIEIALDSQRYLDFVDCSHGWFLFSAFEAGNHMHGLYNSVDGGVTWEALIPPIESPCQKTGLDFVDQKNGWITNACLSDPGHALLEITEDGGSSWLSIHLPPPQDSPDVFIEANHCIASSPTLFSPNSGSLVLRCYAEENVEGFLYVTHNGGQAWSIYPFPEKSFLYFIDEETGWALGFDIYQTLDGGQSWTKMSKVDWGGQFSFVNERMGWALIQSGPGEPALLHTNDGGRTWEVIETNVVIP